MGISMNVDTHNENEFNQQLQMYLAQGYKMESNYNGTAILKKKSYSVALLIVLIIFFFPAAIIYYLVASDDVVTIRNSAMGQASNGFAANSAPNNFASNSAPSQSFDAYCEDCGHGLYKDSKFCPGCGKKLIVESEPVIEVPQLEPAVKRCPNCDTELSDDHKFCPECGENVE